MKKSYKRLKQKGLRQRLPFPQRIKLLFVRFVRVAVIAIVVFALGLLVMKINNFLHSPYFDLSEVIVKGVSEPTKEIVRARIDKAVKVESNLLFLSRRDLYQSLTGLHQLRQLDIDKRYPSTLIISGEEREPQAALVAGKIYMIDDQGVAFEEPGGAKKDSLTFPCITGIPSRQIRLGKPVKNLFLQYALDMIMTLKVSNHRLYTQLSELNINEKSGLTVYLRGGAKIKLGKSHPIDKLPELEAFMKKIRTSQQLQYADFRFKNQIIYVKK